MAAGSDSEGVATWQEGGVVEKPVDAGDDISCCRDPALPAGSSPPISWLEVLFVLVLLQMLVVIGYKRGEVEAERIIIEKIHSFKSIFTSKSIVLCLKLGPETCLCFPKTYEAFPKKYFL